MGGEDGAGLEGVENHLLDTMSSALPEAVNYHRWVMDVIAPHAAGRVLEVGYGHGLYTRMLSEVCPRVTGLDIVPVDPDVAAELPGNVSLVQGDITVPGLGKNYSSDRFDAIVALNVLEHIEDDVAALSNLRATLSAGGVVVVLVPAHEALYGDLDRLAGHYRRYSGEQLRALLEAAELEVVQSRYFNPIGGLGWLANARFGRATSLSDEHVNRQILYFDKFVLPVSRWIDPLTRSFFGQSLIAVGRA